MVLLKRLHHLNGSLMVVMKKMGNIHLCIDLREPNKGIVTDSQSLPHAEDVFMELHGTRMFSTFDLLSTYPQLVLQEDSRDFTAFIMHYGLVHFKCVPYRFAPALRALQRMPVILNNQPGVQSYLDDDIVFMTTPEEYTKTS